MLLQTILLLSLPGPLSLIHGANILGGKLTYLQGFSDRSGLIQSHGHFELQKQLFFQVFFFHLSCKTEPQFRNYNTRIICTLVFIQRKDFFPQPQLGLLQVCKKVWSWPVSFHFLGHLLRNLLAVVNDRFGVQKGGQKEEQ